MAEELNLNNDPYSWQSVYSKPEFLGGYTPSLYQNILGSSDISENKYLQNPQDWSGKTAFEYGMGKSSPASNFYSSVYSLKDDMNNSAQGAEKSSNALMDAHKAVLDLSQGQYAGFEKDIRGNVIGATGKEYRDPESGKVIGKTPDWKADTGGLGRPYTPGLDAFKKAQVESQKASAAAASTPEAIKADQNRKQFLESRFGAGNIPASALTATQQTRAASGASPFAEALKKKTDTNPTV